MLDVKTSLKIPNHQRVEGHHFEILVTRQFDNIYVSRFMFLIFKF